MLVNADFLRSAILTPDQYRWVASPQAGVERVMLDRLGGESARATSIVRYAPASRFPRHEHPAGEEILVLSGTFSEDGESYPAGWYLRNPPGSSHQPSSEQGAIIFVKLRQMRPSESRRTRIDTRCLSDWNRNPDRSIRPLFTDKDEQVSIERIDPGRALFRGAVDGAELLVLTGDLRLGERCYPRGSWIRLPEGNYPTWQAGEYGATLYLKTGRLMATATGA